MTIFERPSITMLISKTMSAAVRPEPARRISGINTLVSIPVLIETVSPEGTFYDTVQVPSGAVDMQLH